METVTSDREANNKALEYIETLFDSSVKIKQLEKNGKRLLLAGNTESLEPDVGYLVHVDVVSGRKDQFKLKQESGKLIGRGVSDMKFSIPIGVALVNDLVKRESDLKMVMVITTDEEVGGFDGADYLASEVGFAPKNLIVPDGGDDWVFVNKSKGVLQVKVKSEGSPAHASRPWLGESAVEPVVKLAAVLLEDYEKSNCEESWETTMNIGKIRAGESTNQVSAKAEMELDFRFPESETIDGLFEKVVKKAEKIDKRLKLEKMSTGQPTATDDSLEVVKAYIESMENKMGEKMKISGAYGASDARHFADLNVPILMSKPTGGDIHGDDEWIDVNSCIKFYEALNLFLKKLENSKL